jgi:hypothetical protein
LSSVQEIISRRGREVVRSREKAYYVEAKGSSEISGTASPWRHRLNI